MRSSYRNKNA